MVYGDISLRIVYNGGLIAADLTEVQTGRCKKVQRLERKLVVSSDTKCSLSGNGEDEIV